MDPNPLFPPTEAISGKISYTEWKLVKKEKLHDGLNFLNIEEKKSTKELGLGSIGPPFPLTP